MSSSMTARWIVGICLSVALVAWLTWTVGNRGHLPTAERVDEHPATSPDELAGARPTVLEGRDARCDVVVVVTASDGTALIDPYVRLGKPPEQKPERLGNGRFVVRQLRPGTWDLVVLSRGLRGLDRKIVVPSPPPPTLEVEVVLTPYARVSGRVIRPDGRAAEGAAVRSDHAGEEGLRWAHPRDQSPSFLSARGSPVAPDGSFRLEFLPADVRVRLTATHPKFGAAFVDLTPRAGENEPLTLTLGPSTSVRGRIPHLPNRARPEVFLFGVQGLGSDQQGVVTCDDDGAFLFEPAAPGNKAITAYLAQDDQVTMWHARTSVAEGESRDVGDLQLGTGADLVLRITAAPPVPEGAVAARVMGALYLPVLDGAEQQTLFVQFHAALDRTVRVVGLPPGSLGLMASVGPTHKGGHVQVRAADRSATPIDVLIPLQPPPVPYREVVITAAPPPGIAAKEFVGVAYVLRDGRPLIGSYMHQRPGAREWSLPVTLESMRGDLVSYCLGHGSMSGPVPVVVDEKENGRARHESWQPAAQVAPRVRDAEGAPIQGANLLVYKSATDEVFGQQPVASLTSDREGRTGCTLWPGEAYVVQCIAAGHVSRMLRIAPETVSAGKTLALDVDLVPAPPER